MTTSQLAKSILIVDDEELFREVVVEGARLFNRSWVVRGAADGAAALELLLQEEADLVVTDLSMPVLDGFQFLAAMQQHRLTPLVIVVSAHVYPELQGQLAHLGSLLCIPKPVNLPDLFQCFDRALTGGRSIVDGLTLAGFCQLLEIERHTCLLRAWYDGQVADLIFRQGELIHAQLDGRVGRSAALEILTWRSAHLEVLPAIDLENRTVEESLTWLLLETSRSLEESKEENTSKKLNLAPSPVADTPSLESASFAVLDLVDSVGVADLVVDQMEEALVMISRTYRVVLVNRAFTNLTGFKASEIIGDTLEVLRGPLTNVLLVSRVLANIEAGKESGGRLVAYKKSGVSFEVEFSIQVLRDAAGRINYFLARQRDVSREKELRDREQRLTQTIEHINWPVVSMNLAGRVVDANSALATWISAPVETIIGKPSWKLPGAPRRARALRQARTLLRQAKSWTWQYETRLILNGVEVRRLVYATITPLFGVASQVVGYVAVAQDVTEKTRLEQIVAVSNLNDTLGMVFASLRHELGNPVNSLKAALNVIISGSTSPERVARYHQLMLQQVERVDYMIEHMRSFGRFDRIELRSIELEPLLVDVNRLLEGVMEKRRCSLEWEVRRGLQVWADSHALVHVFLALVDNAAVAVAEQPPERRKLRISAQNFQESQVTIRIMDQGYGFPASERERIFAPFHSSRTGSLGLGLAIVRRLVTQMGGTIEAHGEVGRGATFTIIVDSPPRGRT